MYRRKLIKNATIVNENRTFVGAVLIDNDRIAEIIEGTEAVPSTPADIVVDASGCFLLPGVIDEHVHFREPGLTHKADMETESRAAAAGGVTTVLDMPNTVPQTTTAEALEAKWEIAARKCCVNHGFFIGATAGNVDLLRSIDPRKVPGVKLFMGSSTGNMLVDKEEALREIFKTVQMPIMTHCEDTDIINANMARLTAELGTEPGVNHHARIRSEEACYNSTALAVKLATEYGAKLHVAHVSTARELEFFSADADARITAEVCVPHLLYTDADYAQKGARIKCNPAIKTAADREALRRALTDGRISAIGTDHAPHLLREKQGGAATAVSGMPMIQFSLPAMLGLVDEGVLGLTDVVRLMCHNPARIFGIEERGFLRVGGKADMVLVRRRSWKLTPNRIESRCGWSPMEGHTFRWAVEKTYCNGRLLYDEGRIVDSHFRGEPVSFCH